MSFYFNNGQRGNICLTMQSLLFLDGNILATWCQSPFGDELHHQNLIVNVTVFYKMYNHQSLIYIDILPIKY